VANRIIVRKVLKGLGIFGILLFLFGIPRGYFLLAGSVAALFLGVTDFGRQCPLILSMRHLAYRGRSKGKTTIVSAKPIEEIVRVDRERTIS
jgi:hypothetical protein